MTGKVYKVGTLNKFKIPVLFQEQEESYGRPWCYIYFLSQALFNKAVRGMEAFKEHKDHSYLKLSISRGCSIYSERDIVLREYVPLQSLITTEELFIPIKNLYPHHMGLSEDWPYEPLKLNKAKHAS